MANPPDELLWLVRRSLHGIERNQGALQRLRWHLMFSEHALGKAQGVLGAFVGEPGTASPASIARDRRQCPPG